jgi:hypothetical protein
MLTKYSQKVIDDFLNHYGGKRSRSNYDSAIKTLFKVIEKDDIKKLTYEDFLNVEGNTSQDTYRTSFFKYVYAFDILENPSGFENIGVKANLKRYFQNKLESLTRTKEKSEYKPSLTIEQIERIESFLNIDDADDINIILLGFCWYMLFYTDCMVDELRSEIDSIDFIDGQIVSGLGKVYEIPIRFHPALNHFKKRNSHTGFAELGTYITKLGKYVGIEKLTPKTVKKAREQNMLFCAVCGEQHPNTLENWVSINNRIVCNSCANEIKKNDNLELVRIENNEIAVLTQDKITELSSIAYTFDTLRDKIIKEKDYIEIHKFMIQIGKAGEAFVYDYEREYLKDTIYCDLVDNTKALNPTNGYDILSYDKKGKKLYIEVKTSVNEDNDFIISDYELETCKKFNKDGKRYLIYRVSNILAKNKSDIKLEIIEDILNSEKYQLETVNWRVMRNTNRN